MTKLRAHYDAKLKAFVPDEPVDMPDGAEVVIDDPAQDPILPPFPENSRVIFTGGPGMTLRDLAEWAGEIEGPMFDESEPDSVRLVRKWRDQPR